MKLLKKLHRVRATGDVKRFSVQSAACHMDRASDKTWEDTGLETPPLPSSMKRIIVEIQHLTLSYVTKFSLHTLATCVCASCLNFFFSSFSLQSQIFTCVVWFHVQKLYWVLTSYHSRKRIHESKNRHSLKNLDGHQHTAYAISVILT